MHNMAADIREEDFTRLQAQIIELRTENYDVEVKFQRQNNELEQLREKTSSLERELEKSQKIIQKSKNKKEYALLLDENEGMQQQLRDHEADFKLQNKTLLEEVTRIEDENKKLGEEIKSLKESDNIESFHETELRRLKAENSVLQKSLKATQERYEDKLLKERKDSETLFDLSKGDNGTESETNLDVDGRSKLEGSEQTLNNEELENGNITIEGELIKLISAAFKTFCVKHVDKHTGFKDKTPEGAEDKCTELKHSLKEEEHSHNVECEYSTEGAEDSNVELKQNTEGADDGHAAELKHNTEKEEGTSHAVECEDKTEWKDQNTVEQCVKELENDDGHSFHCCGKELETLQEHIMSEIHILVQERKICSRQTLLKSENIEKADDGTAHMKYSAQLTEIELSLATEREEKKLLEEQLKSLEDGLRKENAKLKDDVEKLTEKARRKQDSFTKLQEEKENLYNDNRRNIDELKHSYENKIQVLTDQIRQLMENIDTSQKELAEVKRNYEEKLKELNEKLVIQENQATSNVEETIQELDNARIENSSLSEQLQSLHEACESYRTDNEDQKVQIIGLQDQIKEMETNEEKLKTGYDKLKSDLEESTLSYEHLRRQVDEMMSEKEQYLQSTNEAAKLAEKRKQMLDEYSIREQETMTQHKDEMDKLENNHKEAANKKQEEFKRTVEDLKIQLEGEKKLKKALEEKQQQLSDVSTQLSAIESKCGWYERRLTETEEVLNDEREKTKETQQDMKEKHDANINELTMRHAEEIECLNERILGMEQERKEQQSMIEKFNQEIKDKDVENVIAGKKGDHLVKDLKRQLKQERKKSELLQQRLQEAALENRARESFDKIFDPNISRDNGRRNSGDSSMLSGSSLNYDQQEYKESSSPDTSMNISVNDETVDLIARVADIQQEKWQLEERVRHLEESCSSMADDLMKKSEVIQHYAMGTKVDVSKEASSTPESNFKTRMKGTFHIGKQDDLLKDINKKLQAMLEETLIKNMELQKAVDTLSKESSSKSNEHSSNQND